MLDLLLTNGRVVDGTGGPARSANVGVRDGRIEAIGTDRPAARREIDVDGLVVSPGFVDVHTHYDAQVFWDPTLGPSCYHGVTSAVGGNCGFSVAPLDADAAPYLLTMLARVEGMPVISLEEGVPWDWRSFEEYLGRLEGRVGINLGFMAGHSAIRRVVMGERANEAAASPGELDAMTQLLRRCLEAGAMGFSSTISPSHNDAEGLPVPSRFAAPEELVALAGVCRDFPGTTLEMIPGAADFDADATALMIAMSLAAGTSINWNSITIQPGNEEVVARQLRASDQARERGARIVPLTTTQGNTMRLNLHTGFVFEVLEGWGDLFTIEVPERMEMMRDPEQRAQLDARGRSEASGAMRRFAEFQTYVVDHSDTHPELVGRCVGELAAERGVTAIDVLFDVAIDDDLRTVFSCPAQGNDDVDCWRRRAELWRDERTVIGASDAGAHLDVTDGFVYPSRLLAESRDRSLLPLEEAVRQLTTVPAGLLGLTDRGRLQEGLRADVVVFDPDTVDAERTEVRSDLPGGAMRLFAGARGIDRVFVNGTETVVRGEHTGELPGRILRNGRDSR